MSEKNKQDKLPYLFIDAILESVGNMTDKETSKKIVGGCCTAHYRQLNMDSITSRYEGDVEGFISYIESEWDWKVSYMKDTNTIFVDENKTQCVCPLVEKGGISNPILCNCSEGFIDMLFRKVVKKSIKTEVINSILRGDSRCVYKIELI